MSDITNDPTAVQIEGIPIHNPETDILYMEDGVYKVMSKEEAYERGFLIRPEDIPDPAILKPRSTPMWKARAVAKYTEYGEGTLFDAINMAMSQLPLKQRVIAEEAWLNGDTFDMDGELVPMLSGALGLDEEAVQALVDEANTIVG